MIFVKKSEALMKYHPFFRFKAHLYLIKETMYGC